MIEKNKPDIDDLLDYVYEAHFASREERQERWRDYEMVDPNAQWTSEDYSKAVDSGINPLTVNRIFPAVQLLRGMQSTNRLDIAAVARTVKDAEISQLMSEGIQFILDQNFGQFIISGAFNDQISGGFGCVQVTHNPDPRDEKICIKLRDWKDIYWDPFASPWFDHEKCKYVFNHPWIDLRDLLAMYPDKKNDIEEKYKELAGGDSYRPLGMMGQDESTYVEEMRRMNSSSWVNVKRRRVRPVEMWYPVYEKSLFAQMDNGDVYEVKDDMDMMAQIQLMEESEKLLEATVRKMRVCTFLDDLVIFDAPSPHNHHRYPFIPFVGYLDRFSFPYGVPRQLRDMNVEVNKRRSMALALLKSRRVVLERGAAADAAALQDIYEEANKLDGFIVVEDGKMGAINIIDQTQLAPAQMSLLEQSEREIHQISGANEESMGYESNAISGRAMESRKTQGSLITSTLFDNLRRSLKILGMQLVDEIQGNWTSQRVLKITDRMSGAQRFAEINKRIVGSDGNVIVLNDITAGKYDVVISEQPITDTYRDKQLEIIIEATKKATPELAPYLLSVFFELSNIPNKEQMLAKLKPLLGINPADEDLSPEELKQQAIQQLQAQQEKAAMQEQIANQMAQLELAKSNAEIAKLHAEAQRLMQEGEASLARAKVQSDQLHLDAFKTGADVEHKKESNRIQHTQAMSGVIRSMKDASKPVSKPASTTNGTQRSAEQA